MLRAAVIFLVLAVVAYIFGAGGVAGLSMEAARLLIIAFVVLAAISGLVSLISGRRPPQIP